MTLDTMTQPASKPNAPRVWQDNNLAAAWEHAKAEREPVFVPATFFCDDRGWSIMNQMQGVMNDQGQINYSVMYPNVIKAWHRHHKQTDFWLCLHGSLKIGMFNEETGQRWVCITGEKRPGVTIIPPPLWHGGATVGPDPCGLLYYVTHAYDPNEPDEDRRAFDSVDDFPWTVEHK